MLARLIEIVSRLKYVMKGVPQMLEELIAEATAKKSAYDTAKTAKADADTALAAATEAAASAGTNVSNAAGALVAARDAVVAKANELFTPAA